MLKKEKFDSYHGIIEFGKRKYELNDSKTRKDERREKHIEKKGYIRRFERKH